MIIPVLHSDKEVQLKDLIRFDASKSLLVKGSVGAINYVTIKAGADQTAVEVNHANPKNWFLDFMFSSYGFDVDASNSSLVFEANGIKYTTNVATGTYSLAPLLTAIKTAIEAVASPLTVSFTVDERNRVSCAPSLPLKFLPNTSSADLLPHIGFKEDGQLVGFPVEYGLRKITLTVATAHETNSISEFVKVYTEDGDALFSDDADLVAEENDIMKWLPAGKGSYKYLHRRSQKLILDFMDRQGYRDDQQRKITKFAFVDNTDVRMWSYYQALRLFFIGAENDVDDVFKKKAAYYEKLEIASRDRAVLSLDLDGDDKKDLTEGPDIRSGRLYFR